MALQSSQEELEAAKESLAAAQDKYGVLYQCFEGTCAEMYQYQQGLVEQQTLVVEKDKLIEAAKKVSCFSCQSPPYRAPVTSTQQHTQTDILTCIPSS